MVDLDALKTEAEKILRGAAGQDYFEVQVFAEGRWPASFVIQADAAAEPAVAELLGPASAYEGLPAWLAAKIDRPAGLTLWRYEGNAGIQKLGAALGV